MTKVICTRKISNYKKSRQNRNGKSFFFPTDDLVEFGGLAVWIHGSGSVAVAMHPAVRLDTDTET